MNFKQGLKQCMACCRLQDKSCVPAYEAADMILQSDQDLREFAEKMNGRTDPKFKDHIKNSGLLYATYFEIK